MRNINKVLLIVIASLVSLTSMADIVTEFDGKLLNLQQSWANVNYILKSDPQEESFEELLIQAEAFVNDYPKKAETWIWQGIIQSSYAGSKGGLGALSLAKKAKKSFEKAISLDETALNGSAFTSLGTLYHKVPGWPISFGDDDDAQDLLKKAVTMNPKGIDSNYFYGEFLYDEGKYEMANEYLHNAQNAPARETRPIADKNRQDEIQALLTKVEKKLTAKKR